MKRVQVFFDGPAMDAARHSMVTDLKVPPHMTTGPMMTIELPDDEDLEATQRELQETVSSGVTVRLEVVREN